MYRTRRQNRYNNLRKVGFVNFEARGLSRVSPKVPYLLPLMKERNAEYEKEIRRAKRKGLTEVEFNKWWLTHIKLRYVAKKWKHKGDAWGVTAAFRMLKNKEKAYKLKYPEYDSPWEKRQKDWRDFVTKIDRTYEKYPTGKAYGKRKPPVKLRYLPEGGAEIVE